MLKNKFKVILIILISIIISSAISVYATYNYLAKDISYTRSNGTTISVEDALNELYKNQKQLMQIGQCNLDTSYGTSRTFELKNINDYKNIVVDDIYVVINKLAPSGCSGQSTLDYQNIQKNYNNESGVLTITVPKVYYQGAGVWLGLDIYLYH